jgi:hypothetical protein
VISIRKLTNRDMLTVIGMLKTVGASAGSRLSSLVVAGSGVSKNQDSSSEEESGIKIGFLVLTELYENLIDDLTKWIASLAGKSLEDYLEMPPETTIDIIEQLVEGEDSKRFFSRALQLSKKMSGLSGIFGKKSRDTESPSDSQSEDSSANDFKTSSSSPIALTK